MSPEARARQRIDELLGAAGWHVRDYRAADLHAARGVAIREFELAAGHGTAEFLRYYFLTDDGILKIGEASPGGAGRNRTLGLEKLMAIQVPVPTLAAQQTINRLQADIAALKAKHTAIRQANAAVLPATLERLFAGST